MSLFAVGVCACVLLSLPSTLIGGVLAVAITGGTLTLGSMVGLAGCAPAQ